MSITPIPGGSFDSACHVYRDERGKFVVSLTQILDLCGFYSYNGVSREVMQKAAERGSDVHRIAWSLAKYGDVDESWISDELRPRHEALVKFFAETGFTADPEWVEKPIIATVNGFKFGLTPDAIGFRNHVPQVVEFKCCDTEQPAWAVQTMAQALGRYGQWAMSARRMAVMLKSDGKYRLCPHENQQHDRAVFMAALTCVQWRLTAGQKIQEMVS